MSEKFAVSTKEVQVTEVWNRIRFAYNYDGPEREVANQVLTYDGMDKEYVYYSDMGNSKLWHHFQFTLERMGLLENAKPPFTSMKPCVWWDCDGLVDSDNYCILCGRGQG